MTTPTLGRTSSGPAPLDVDRLVGGRMLLQASSGYGKSWALRRILEQTHGRVQQIVIDPEGEFYTLREKFDYVLAGKGGDCPADPRAAKLLARRLLELGVSAILDLSELTLEQKRRFVREFLGSLVGAPRDLWHPALVVVDEAHLFAPESGKGKAESLGAIVDLMSRGRKRGFCGILATQRLSKLSKDAAAECNNWMVGRATLEDDVKRAGDELGMATKLERAALKRLKPGEFFAFGPALGAGDVQRIHVGGVLTSHPKAGAAAPKPAAPRAKIVEVLGQLADLPAEVEEEARTMADLQRQVRELAAANRKLEKGMGAPGPEALEAARAEGAEVGRREMVGALRALREQGEVARAALSRAGADVQKALDALSEPVDVDLAALPAPRRVTAAAPRASRPAPTRAPAAPAAPVEGLDGPMQRILDAMAWLDAAGVREPWSRTQVAMVARYKPSGGGFNNALGRLRSGGLIRYPQSGELAFEDAGRAAAADVGEPPTIEELHARVLGLVDGPMAKILRVLLDAYPDAMSREDIAAETGYQPTGGGFNNALGRLRTLGLIDYPQQGYAVALPLLFMEG